MWRTGGSWPGGGEGEHCSLYVLTEGGISDKGRDLRDVGEAAAAVAEHGVDVGEDQCRLLGKATLAAAGDHT